MTEPQTKVNDEKNPTVDACRRPDDGRAGAECTRV